MQRLRKVALAGLTILVLTSLSLWVLVRVHYARTPESRVTVINQTNEFAWVTLTLCDRSLLKQNLEPNGSKQVPFKPPGCSSTERIDPPPQPSPSRGEGD